MPQADRPKFMEIKDVIRNDILAGRLPSEARVPSEREIAREYDVALMTARRALSELADEGYVVRRHGKGTFVAPVKPRRTERGGRRTFRYILIGRRATDPAYSVIIHHLVRAASNVDADLVSSEVSTEGGADRTRVALRDLILGAAAIGGLVINGDTTEDQILEIQNLGIPFVLGDTPSPRLAHTCDCVTYDHRAAAELLVEHLVDLGHRRIGLVAGMVAVGWPVYIHAMASQEFREGYCAALARHNIPVDRRLIYGVKKLIDVEEGCLAMRHLLSLSPAPTAIVTLSNRLAIGALQCLKEQGLAVPDDISVTSAADFAPAREADPPITVAGEDHEELARETIRLLIERIQGVRTEPRDVRPELRLTVRESTGPCPDAAVGSTVGTDVEDAST